MTRRTDLILTAMAPAIWGSTYLTTTEFLPEGYPLTVSVLRALPAGLLLLLVVRQLPKGGIWWRRAFILGALNFSIFWGLLFVAAYRLPGGVAATVTSIQPLVVMVLARLFLGSPLRALSLIAAVAGIGGIALLILTPAAVLDPIGLAAGLGGAVSMAAGTVFTRRWQPNVSPLTFTAWQLTTGGLLLVPVALWLEPPLPALTGENAFGLAYLCLIGAAATYIVWFRGISRLEPSIVAPLGFLSPVTAVILGWVVLGQQLSTPQMVGMVIVLASVWLSQQVWRSKPPKERKSGVKWIARTATR